MKEPNLEKIFLSNSFEVLLKHCYGRKYHQYCGEKTKAEYSKVLLKLVNSIKTGVEINIEQVDNKHKQDLIDKCDNIINGIEQASSVNEISEKMVVGLVRITFGLLGNQPDHWNRKKVNNAKHWRLNQYRQITYISSLEQKVNLIIDSAPPIGIASADDYNSTALRRKLHRDFNGSHAKFLEWFKSEFKDGYLRLF